MTPSRRSSATSSGSSSQSVRVSVAGPGRADLRERLERETFDIAIIGGGITGSGIARDAAMRGLSVALLEKGDFASGASGRSSRLIHGGLRYLRYRQIRLVREALRERGLLLRLAPHLVRPAAFVLPLYREGRDSPLVLRLGLLGYDVLAGTLGIDRHRAVSKETLAQDEPHLRTRGLRGGFRYLDALTDDARLTLAVALSAVRQGAAALNYMEAVSLDMTTGRVTGVHYRDLVGGGQGTVRARVVVSAAGPWTDQVRSLAGAPGLLRPTKGIHVVVPRSRLGTNAAVTFGWEDRLLFAVPQGRHTYLGTTDTDYAGDPGDIDVDGDDVSYVLEATNRTFETGLSIPDVVATWAGVRPLLREEGVPSSISRDYVILDGPPGLVTIAGGKLTTFRSMAQNLLDEVIEREGAHLSRRPRRCGTLREPLPGGEVSDLARYVRSVVADLSRTWGLTEDAARRLVEVYGTEHERVLACAAREPGLLEPLAPGCAVLAVEAAHAAGEEMALTLEDFLWRRSSLMLFGDDGGVAEAAAGVMARTLAWSPEETQRQLASYRGTAERMLAFGRRTEAGDVPAAGGSARTDAGGAEGR